MLDFKFFRNNKARVFTDYMDQMDDYFLGGIQSSIVRNPEIIPNEEYEGWRAHYNNLPPGQCPYDIGTQEREHWMTGWSNRENAYPQPIEPDDLCIELTDTDTGENFGIPTSMYTEISYRGKVLFEQSRTVSGRCGRDPYEYWIDNVYNTLEDTLVIEVTVSVPFGAGNGRVTFHKFRQIIPYETI